MNRLFINERYSPEANELCNRLISATEKIAKEYFDKGYSPRDIQNILFSAAFDVGVNVLFESDSFKTVIAKQKPKELTPEGVEEVKRFLCGKMYIDAIKHVRQETNLSLKESKELVDKINSGLPINQRYQLKG